MTGLASYIDGIPIVANVGDRTIRFATPDLDQRVYNKEDREIQRWNGSSWTVDLPAFADAIPVVADNTARDAAFPAPETNQRVYNIAARAIQRWTGVAWTDDIGSYAEGIPTVADNTARDAAFPAPATNQRVYNIAARAIQRWTGAAWTVDLPPYADGIPVVADNTARDAAFPAPATDQRVYNKGARMVQRWTGAAWVSEIHILNAGAAASLRFEAGNVVDVVAASGANVAGSDLTLAAGQGTGNAAPGRLVMKAAALGSSGSTAETLFEAAIVEVDAGSVKLSVDTPAASTLNPTLHLRRAGTVKGLLGVAGAAGQVVPGSAQDDLVLRTQGGALHFSTDGGASSAAKLTAAGQLIISQGANDGEIFSLKSSDVAHGMTNRTETDTYGALKKANINDGGLFIGAYAESTAAQALRLSCEAGTGDTTKTSGAAAACYITASKKNGVDVQALAADENVLAVANGGSALMLLDADGDLHVAKRLLVGALGVTTGFQTIGLTVQQGANSDEAFTLKSTSVAHGMTTVADTDTYCTIKKLSGSAGVAVLQGYGVGARALDLNGAVTVGDTTKANNSDAPVCVNAALKTGTTNGVMSANQNMMTVRTNGIARFILDADGDSHQDVGTAWSNFDVFDDIEILNALAAHVTRADDPIRANFREWIEQPEYRTVLTKYRLVTFNDDGHHFVNMSKLTMLLCGAVRQMGARFEDAMRRLDALTGDVRALKGAA